MPKPRNKSGDPFVQVTFSKNDTETSRDKVTPETNQNKALLKEEAPKVLQWNEPETRLLLQIMSIIYTPMLRCKENRIRGIMYDKAFVFFKQRLEADCIGNNIFRAYITKAKMKDKWAEMKKGFQDLYVAAISNKTPNVHPREKWSYFDDMAEILKEDKTAFPSISTQSTEQQSSSSEQEKKNIPQPLTREDIISENTYSSDLYIFREQLEEQIVNHHDCVVKKIAKSTKSNKNETPIQQATMVETPAQPAPAPPGIQYTNIAPPVYMPLFQMVESVKEANRAHLNDTRALFEEMHMRTVAERLKRKADMEEFESRYITRRRTDEERMERLLSSQREIIDVIHGLLNNSRKDQLNRPGN